MDKQNIYTIFNMINKVSKKIKYYINKLNCN